MFYSYLPQTGKNQLSFDWLVLKQSVVYPNAEMIFIHPKGLLI